MIIADECLNGNLVRALENAGFTVHSIARNDSGIDDRRVLEVAERLGGVLITEDSDFGEWVFAHHLTKVTVVFLRYRKADYLVILNFLLHYLREIEETADRQFITVNKNKIRFRKI